MRARDARASLCGARARGSKAGEKYLVWIDLRFFRLATLARRRLRKATRKRAEGLVVHDVDACVVGGAGLVERSEIGVDVPE